MIVVSLEKHPQSSDTPHRESLIKIAGLMIKPFSTLDYSRKTEPYATVCKTEHKLVGGARRSLRLGPWLVTRSLSGR